MKISKKIAHLTYLRFDWHIKNIFLKSFVQLFAVTTQLQEEKEDDVDMIESKDTIPAVAWLDMMYEESGLTQTRANEAAIIIQVNKLNYKKLFYICI